MAERFRAEVWIENDGARADGKSIMSLLALAAVEGAALEILALGDDAEEAVEALAKLVDRGLPEI
jgi:phosphotransferase system HPr (HPr) family protein